jgi:DMSO reductase anchor subunit
MNEIAFNVLAFLIVAFWVAYVMCGMVKLWMRMDEYPIISKFTDIDNTYYFLLLFLFTVISAGAAAVTLVMYKEGILDTAVFALLALLGFIFAPRFFIDVCRGLKYNAKTGELERIKELEKRK